MSRESGLLAGWSNRAVGDGGISSPPAFGGRRHLFGRAGSAPAPAIIGLALWAASAAAQEQTQAAQKPCLKTADILYVDHGDARLQALDVHAPPDASDQPVIVWIHGGGLAGGDKSEEAGKVAFFCQDGFVLVVPNHRLSPAVKHPAHAEDVAAAVAWTYAHVREFGGDPGRIALFGYNTGGYLAAFVGTAERMLKKYDLSPRNLRALALLDGHDYDVAGTGKRLAGNPLLSDVHDRMGDDPEVWRDATILEHVGGGKGIPPTLIVVSEKPRTHYTPGLTAKPLAAALQQAGVETTYYVATGKDAREVGRDVGSGDETTRAVLQFLHLRLDR